MRKVFVVMGLLLVAGVAMVLTIAVLSRLAPVFGIGLAALVTFYAAVGAAWAGTHSVESRAVADDVIGAFADINMNRKEAADRLDISLSQLNRMLAGYDMLPSPYKLAQLGSRFREAYHSRAVNREGRGQYLANSLVLEILHNVRRLTGEHVVTGIAERRIA